MNVSTLAGSDIGLGSWPARRARISPGRTALTPRGVKAVVLDADGDHLSAGLDLSELTERDAFEGLEHSMMWHHAFERLERGRLPVVAVLKGAVIGGGLELATAAHIRVAEPSAFYALPEGQRGLFVGGGASVRVPRLIGAHRTGRSSATRSPAPGRGCSSSASGEATGSWPTCRTSRRPWSHPWPRPASARSGRAAPRSSARAR
jgi:hypothetical protein